jgi:hypothetical protein
MASSTSSASAPPPQAQAGGGLPSSSSTENAISTFGPSIISYLKEISAGVRPFDETQFREIAGVSEGGTVSKAEKLDLNMLFAYMRSTSSNAMSPPAAGDVDFSYPLSWYFISTSHNTYLSGNQLYGVSSAEAYQNVSLVICLFLLFVLRQE